MHHKKIKLPDKEENRWLHFKNFANKLKVPFVIYADFECFTTPIDTCTPNPTRSSTTKYQEHVASSYGYIIFSANGKIYNPVIYRGGGKQLNIFLENLRKEKQKIINILKNPAPMKISPDQENDF